MNLGKQVLKFCLLMSLMILSSVTLHAQVPVSDPACVYCSARVTKGEAHRPGCMYARNSGSTSSSYSSGSSIQQVILESIFTNLFNNLFNMGSNNNKISEAEKLRQQQEEQLRQARLAQMKAMIKRYNDSVRQVRHDEMMKDYKKIDNGSNSDITFKPLPSAKSAPMTQEERERQQLLKKGIKVTWNYNEFSNIKEGQITEQESSPDLTANEKLINDMISEIEDNGGRLAAITGRYIINVKDGVFKYLDDASSAAIGGNPYVMQETGEQDVRKISTNALYNTASQTAKIYYDKIKDAGMEYIKEKNIGILKNATIDKLREYEKFDDLAKSYEQIK